MSKQKGIFAGLVGASGGALLLALASTPLALAQTDKEPAAISMGAPKSVGLGEKATLQARLVDGDGAPIAKAKIDFVTAQEFLNVDDDVVLVEGVTDDQGLAAADWDPRTSGDITVEAVFRGDDRYEAAKTSAPVTVTGDRQLYVQQAGVRVPVLNASPLAAAAGLWPRLSSWPLVLALLIVWSLYGRVALFLSRIAQLGATVPVPEMIGLEMAALPPMRGGSDDETEGNQR
ncbi:MAG: Ig-like domain repeat protein [Chloroflexota bacterium]|nr:Ig-like domain repeat protein [Chloroflexota bacterium]